MSGMRSVRASLHQMPRLVRLCVGSMLMVGVLAMHTVISTDDIGSMTHHSAMAAADAAAASSTVAVSAPHVADLPSVSAIGGALGSSMADCGGLGILCLAMIVGLSAYIILRRRGLDLLLWQLPPPQRIVLGHPRTPFQAQDPRERTSVLRR